MTYAVFLNSWILEFLDSCLVAAGRPASAQRGQLQETPIVAEVRRAEVEPVQLQGKVLKVEAGQRHELKLLTPQSYRHSHDLLRVFELPLQPHAEGSSRPHAHGGHYNRFFRIACIHEEKLGWGLPVFQGQTDGLGQQSVLLVRHRDEVEDGDA